VVPGVVPRMRRREGTGNFGMYLKGGVGIPSIFSYNLHLPRFAVSSSAQCLGPTFRSRNSKACVRKMGDKESMERAGPAGGLSSDLPSMGDILSGVSAHTSPIFPARDVGRDDIEKVNEDTAMRGEFVKIDGAIGGSGYDETTVE
jgi:hypothetical protein